MASHVVKEAAAALRAAAKFNPGEERPFLDGIKQKAARKPAPKIDPSLDIDALMAAHRKKHGVA
jgi:hypothetical protein